MRVRRAPRAHSRGLQGGLLQGAGRGAGAVRSDRRAEDFRYGLSAAAEGEGVRGGADYRDGHGRDHAGARREVEPDDDEGLSELSARGDAREAEGVPFDQRRALRRQTDGVHEALHEEGAVGHSKRVSNEIFPF